MAQYLLSMLGGGARGAPLFMPMGMMGEGLGGTDQGRWGDYVFSQEGKNPTDLMLMMRRMY